MGAIYALFSAFYYWIGKITGYQYNNILSFIHFWIFTIAINIVFLPMHALGLNGMFIASIETIKLLLVNWVNCKNIRIICSEVYFNTAPRSRDVIIKTFND